MTPFHLQLLTIVAEPKARKTVANAYSIPSGVLPVLAAIGFWSGQGEFTHPRELYGAEMGAATLIRRYVALLVRASMVERSTAHRRMLRATPRGHEALGKYERELREGVAAFAQVRPKRVLVHSLR
jgi:hypothetical protein